MLKFKNNLSRRNSKKFIRYISITSLDLPPKIFVYLILISTSLAKIQDCNG